MIFNIPNFNFKGRCEEVLAIPMGLMLNRQSGKAPI